MTDNLRLAAPRKTAILVAAFDSQLKWADTIRQGLESRGFSCQLIIPSDIRHAISDRQLAVYCGSAATYMHWTDLITASLNADVVVLAIQGPQVQRFCHDLFDVVELGDATPPVTISGWVGVIIENITAGYLARYTTDIVAVNSRSDLATPNRSPAVWGCRPTIYCSVVCRCCRAGIETCPSTPIKTVMFADQPTVPQTREDRLYVYQRLMAYAHAHPDRQVVLKPRHRIGEDTFHRMKFHPEVLLAGLQKPPNFFIDHTPVSERLADLDLMLTVSSTAAIEAVGAGVRTAFIADLDVREQLGNHIFLDSGLLRTFDQLEQDEIGVPNQAWIEDYFFDIRGRTPAQQIADRAAELTERPDRDRPQAWQTPLFRSQHELITYRRQVAAGIPVVGDRAAVLRAIAKWVLPHGVHSQLRQARARRKALPQTPAERQPIRIG